MVDVPLLPGSTSASFVGRTRELAEVADLLGIGSTYGPARAVLLAGDAGVGKTRLLTELRDHAFAAGWQVVAGHCLDFGDSGLPYLPFSEIIGRLVTERPALVDAITADHPALGRLRPGRRLMSGADERSESLDRGALYDGVHALLDAAGAEQPLLLVVEDTHWADSSSRDLLSFLFSRPFASRVALVASYRSDDLHRRHPLRRTAAEWGRIPGVVRLQLEPLPTDDVRTLVRALQPAPLTESEFEHIVRRADGNAFFVEELVGAAGLPGAIPDDLADLLMVRLDQLGDDAQVVVRWASVAGRRVSHQLLAAVSDQAPAALDAGLRDAIEHHVLVPSGSDSYAFRHALLAEAVYDDLLPGERIRLHASYVDALVSGRAVGTAAELARHAGLARDLTTSLDASVQAGDEAMSVAGAVEAAQHYERALGILADPSFPVGHDVDVADLGSRAADALVAAGNPPRALALAEELLERLPDDASTTHRAQLLAAAAGTVMVAETTRDALDFTGPALAALPDEPSFLRARLLHLHARALFHAHRADEARELALEALGMTESLGEPRLGSEVLATLAAFDRDDGVASPEDVAEALERAAETAAVTGAVSAELRALWLMGRWRYDRAEFAKSKESFERAYAHAERIGMQWAPYGFDSRFSLLQLAHLTGDWDHGVELAEVSGQLPPPIPEAILAAGLLAIQAGRGQTDRLSLAPVLRRLWEQDGIIAVSAAPATVELYGVLGNRKAALAEHDDAVATLTRLWRGTFHGRVRLAAATLAALSVGLDAESSAVRTTVVADAERVWSGGVHTLETLREVGTTWGPEGEAWASRLTAEHLRLRWLAGTGDAPGEDELVAAWRHDLACFTTFGHVIEVARSRARLAAVLQSAGDVAEARELTDAARETATALGAKPLLGELRSLGGGGPRPRVVEREQLTPREREILALVAAGRSNGEIGKQLFIATKTVSVHVSNILAKLGASGRTEAAAIARREGLLDPGPP